MSGQSITDRITAAQHSVTGSAVSKTVCKATTHEIMGPKKKHLDCEYVFKPSEITTTTTPPPAAAASYTRPQKPLRLAPMLTANFLPMSRRLFYLSFNIKDRPCQHAATHC